MAEPVYQGQNASPITSTTTIAPGPGEIVGIFVSSASNTPTIKVGDGTAVPIATFTPVSATWYPMPFRFNTSLIVTIGGTVACTVMWGT